MSRKDINIEDDDDFLLKKLEEETNLAHKFYEENNTINFLLHKANAQEIKIALMHKEIHYLGMCLGSLVSSKLEEKIRESIH